MMRFPGSTGTEWGGMSLSGLVCLGFVDSELGEEKKRNGNTCPSVVLFLLLIRLHVSRNES